MMEPNKADGCKLCRHTEAFETDDDMELHFRSTPHCQKYIVEEFRLGTEGFLEEYPGIPFDKMKELLSTKKGQWTDHMMDFMFRCGIALDFQCAMCNVETNHHSWISHLKGLKHAVAYVKFLNKNTIEEYSRNYPCLPGAAEAKINDARKKLWAQIQFEKSQQGKKEKEEAREAAEANHAFHAPKQEYSQAQNEIGDKKGCQGKRPQKHPRSDSADCGPYGPYVPVEPYGETSARDYAYTNSSNAPHKSLKKFGVKGHKRRKYDHNEESSMPSKPDSIESGLDEIVSLLEKGKRYKEADQLSRKLAAGRSRKPHVELNDYEANTQQQHFLRDKKLEGKMEEERKRKEEKDRIQQLLEEQKRRQEQEFNEIVRKQNERQKGLEKQLAQMQRMLLEQQQQSSVPTAFTPLAFGQQPLVPVSGASIAGMAYPASHVALAAPSLATPAALAAVQQKGAEIDKLWQDLKTTQQLYEASKKEVQEQQERVATLCKIKKMQQEEEDLAMVSNAPYPVQTNQPQASTSYTDPTPSTSTGRSLWELNELQIKKEPQQNGLKRQLKCEPGAANNQEEQWNAYNQGRWGENQDQRGQNHDHRGQNYDHRGQNYDQRSQNYDQPSQNYDQRSPNHDHRGQNYDQRSQNYDQRDQDYDQRSQNYDQRDQDYDQRSPNHDQRSPNHDHRGQNYNQRSPNYDQRDQDEARWDQNQDQQGQSKNQRGRNQNRRGESRWDPSNIGQTEGSSQGRRQDRGGLLPTPDSRAKSFDNRKDRNQRYPANKQKWGQKTRYHSKHDRKEEQQQQPDNFDEALSVLQETIKQFLEVVTTHQLKAMEVLSPEVCGQLQMMTSQLNNIRPGQNQAQQLEEILRSMRNLDTSALSSAMDAPEIEGFDIGGMIQGLSALQQLQNDGNSERGWVE